MGNEAVFATSGGGDIQTAGILGTSLPDAIDNSQSTAFPPIGNQGSLNSCTTWATTYYQMTYENNLARGEIAK